MKNFYINVLGMELVSEEKGRNIFLKAGSSMLLIFNPATTITRSEGNSHIDLPTHGAITPPSSIHFALEIDKDNYHNIKETVNKRGIKIEKEVLWADDINSIYFRDPAGNLVEIITHGMWPT
jgi:catechol 2,3-dioxygenase-like lactoylglutathione lyase family enzyme